MLTDRASPPEMLGALPGWIMWRYESFKDEPKPRKVPYYWNGMRRHGQQGSPTDRANLVTFAAARDAAVRMGFDGVGLALLPDWQLTALDVDNCVDADGKIPDEIHEIVRRTYAEYSPSGKGIRAFFFGNLGNHKSHTSAGPYGLETFSSNGFVTFTGNILPHVDILGYEDRVAPVPEELAALCQSRFGTSSSAVFDPYDFMAGREPRLGLTVEQMKELLSALDPNMPREPWLRVGLALHHECEGDDTGFDRWDEWSSEGAAYPGTEGLRYQWDSFKGPTPGSRQVTMASVIKMAKEAAAIPHEAEWPTPAPLPDALLPVPAMTPDMLPKELSPWLTDIAERMSVPLDFVGIPAMVMLGSLIGRRVLVRPEQFTDWSEPANLWGALVASPGAMKTPVVSQVFEPIRRFESEAQTENRVVLSNHELALLINKTAKNAALSGTKGKTRPQTYEEIEQALMSCAVEPPKPKLKRYITTDATVEKLGEICADNPDGILYHRDELPTLFLDLQREEKAPVRGFLLTGWAGLEAYTFDRIGRGTTHIEAVNISLFGTAQPQRIAKLVATSTAKHDDGMIQRLQLLAWPDLNSGWVPADRTPDSSARDAAFACCRRLSQLSGATVHAEVDGVENPPYLRLSINAQAVFNDYRKTLEAKVRSGSLPEPLAAHLAKFRGLVPRLALILQLAGGGIGRITEEVTCVAVKWAHYLEAHARRMYASVDIITSDTARLLLTRIRNNELRDGFSQRDITQKGWSGLRDAEQVALALTTLEQFGWLRSHKIPTTGRPKEIFHINPAAMTKIA